MDLSRELKAWRADNFLSQQAAAERVGVTRNTYYKWEAGRAEPSIEALGRLHSAGLPVAKQRAMEQLGVIH